MGRKKSTGSRKKFEKKKMLANMTGDTEKKLHNERQCVRKKNSRGDLRGKDGKGRRERRRRKNRGMKRSCSGKRLDDG